MTEEMLREQLQRERSRLQVVERINRLANSALDMGEVLGEVALIIREAMPVDLVAIFQHDEQTNDMALRATSDANMGMDGHYAIHLGEQFTGAVAQRGVSDGITDVTTWGVPPLETSIFGAAYHGLFVMPIICFSGEASLLEGALTLLSREPLTLSPDEIGFLELISGQLALSIENSKIYHHAEEARLRQYASAAVLQSISATVATSFDLMRVLQMIITSAVQMSEANHGAIFLFDEETGALNLAAHHHMQEPALRDVALRDGECCVRRAADQQQWIWDRDCMHTCDECYLRRFSDQMHNIHTSLAVPLLSKGLVKGVLHLLSSDLYLRARMQTKMIETFANEAAIAIESTQLYEETRTSLELRSQLYQEMHHRVKNNLLSIAAILRMEKRRTSSPEVDRILSESISRIDGMAATHDLLSNEDHIGTANLSDLATKIVGVVSAYLIAPELKVQFQVIPTTIEVHSKRALVLALIINELLANAIEHGMADRTSGQVRIGAWLEDDKVHFIFANDGPDLPADLDISQTASLGLSLVRDMMRNELKGTLSLRRGPLPPFLRTDPADETPWTLAELVFVQDHEGLSISVQG